MTSLGGELVWTSADETVLWNRLTKQTLLTLKSRYMVLFADGAFVWGAPPNATADQAQPLHVCEPETGEVLQQLVYHKDMVSAMCLFKETLWTGSADGSICVWKSTSPAMLLLRSNRSNARLSSMMSLSSSSNQQSGGGGSTSGNVSGSNSGTSLSASMSVPRVLLGTNRPAAATLPATLGSASDAVSSSGAVGYRVQAPPSPRTRPPAGGWGATPSAAQATSQEWPIAYRAAPSPSDLAGDYDRRTSPREESSPGAAGRARTRSYTIGGDSPVRSRELPQAYAVAAEDMPSHRRPGGNLPPAYAVEHAEPAPAPARAGRRQKVALIDDYSDNNDEAVAPAAAASGAAPQHSSSEFAEMYQAHKALSRSEDRIAKDSYNIADDGAAPRPATASSPKAALRRDDSRDSSDAGSSHSGGGGSASAGVSRRASREPSLSLALLRDMGRSSAHAMSIPTSSSGSALDTDPPLPIASSAPDEATRLSHSSNHVPPLSRLLADDRLSRRHSVNSARPSSTGKYDM